jgi:serine/threonine protein kinase
LKILIFSRYVAPEILSDLKPSFAEMTRVCSQASDVYSFGMVVYEIVSRTAPFYDFSEEDARAKILAGDQPVLPSEFQGTYSKYDELIRATTARDPDSRPGDFLQIRQFFENM